MAAPRRAAGATPPFTRDGRDMQQYVLRRLLLALPTIGLVSLFAFAVIRLVPGDVVTLMFEDLGYAESIEVTRQKLGLDQPLHVQYVRWLGQVFSGDLGESLWTKRPALTILRERLPVTLELGAISILVSLVWGVGLGVMSALRQDSVLDYVGRSTAIAFLSLPTFWLGTLALVVPAKYFGWSPSPRYVPFFDDPAANLVQFALPGLILGSHLGAPVMRMTRAMMLEVLRQDYIRTAWAKGLREGVIIARHAVRNAVIPVVTILGIQLANAIGGTVILETIFQLPGMGSFVVDSVAKRDYPMLQALVLVFATFVILVNLVVDVTYGWLDPRIRLR